jgi:uncharacterized damage-inducible protein DinB
MSRTFGLRMVDALYEYHWWANRRLFDHAAGLGPAVTDRPLGSQFSAPTIKDLFAHIYGADGYWFAGLGPLRIAWDTLEAEQHAYLSALGADDLERVLEYGTLTGQSRRLPLWTLLQHVPNHATHHRSELATMLTMASGSPPDTGVHTYHAWKTGQS